MEVYAGDHIDASYKDDHSPLTRADIAAHDLIVSSLEKMTPDIPVLSEESQTISYDVRQTWKRFWLVDPLDGTKEFIKKNADFTVNIALIDDGVPILGVVHAPALGVTYYGETGGVAFKQTSNATTPITVAAYQATDFRVVASRSHGSEALDQFLNKIGATERVSRGSSLKLCLVAEGAAHLYPRFGPTMEWDTAAGQAVVTAAGGSVTDFQGAPLRYNKPDLHNPNFMVAGSPAFPWWQYLEGQCEG
jgi:3'(2'), 5'-bisphosphate nucleotidase